MLVLSETICLFCDIAELNYRFSLRLMSKGLWASTSDWTFGISDHQRTPTNSDIVLRRGRLRWNFAEPTSCTLARLRIPVVGDELSLNRPCTPNWLCIYRRLRWTFAEPTSWTSARLRIPVVVDELLLNRPCTPNWLCIYRRPRWTFIKSTSCSRSTSYLDRHRWTLAKSTSQFKLTTIFTAVTQCWLDVTSPGSCKCYSLLVWSSPKLKLQFRCKSHRSRIRPNFCDLWPFSPLLEYYDGILSVTCDIISLLVYHSGINIH